MAGTSTVDAAALTLTHVGRGGLLTSHRPPFYVSPLPSLRTELADAVAAPDDAEMSLFMMKVRLGLAAAAAGGSGSGSARIPPRSAAPYAAPLTPPSSDCGGDYDDVQTGAETSAKEDKGDVLGEGEQVRGFIMDSLILLPSSLPVRS